MLQHIGWGQLPADFVLQPLTFQHRAHVKGQLPQPETPLIVHPKVVVEGAANLRLVAELQAGYFKAIGLVEHIIELQQHRYFGVKKQQLQGIKHIHMPQLSQHLLAVIAYPLALFVVLNELIATGDEVVGP